MGGHTAIGSEKSQDNILPISGAAAPMSSTCTLAPQERLRAAGASSGCDETHQTVACSMSALSILFYLARRRPLQPDRGHSLLS